MSVSWATLETPVMKQSMTLCLYRSPSASWLSSLALSSCSLGWLFSSKGKRRGRGETGIFFYNLIQDFIKNAVHAYSGMNTADVFNLVIVNKLKNKP